MELTKVRLETTVESTLLRAKFELLPEEMARDSQTRWVAEFDQLSRQRSQERGVYDRERLRKEDILDLIVAPIVQNALTPKISFYFASLFHIGRQWKVARYAANTAREALTAENLEKTAELNLQSFVGDFERLDIAPDERRTVLLDSLRELLSYSEEQHIQKIERAKRLWSVWKEEVRELQDILNESSQRFNDFKYYEPERGRRWEREREPDYSRRYDRAFIQSLYKLIFFSIEQRQLFHLLHQDGIQFKSITDPPQAPAALAQLLQLALMRGSEGALTEGIRDCFESYRRVLHYQEAVAEQQRLSPVVAQVEARLLKLFEAKNPFQNYQALKSPPDIELRRLWNECKLPNRKMFHYAENWLNSLEAAPNFYYEKLPYKPSFDEDDIISYSRSADSGIKRGWVNTSRETLRTDCEFIQQLFEKWIEAVARGALYPTIKEKGAQEWDVNSFHNLIDKVVNYLNTLGYSLTTPSLDRLKVLWGELAKKDRPYSPSINW